MTSATATRSGAQPRAAWEHEATLAHVRPQIRELLARTEAFERLPAREQAKFANELVRVAAYLARPEGEDPAEVALAAPVAASGSPAGRAANEPLATAQVDGADAAATRATKDKGPAGKDFEAGAARQYTQAFGDLVTKVDFPVFVGGLIHNVFEAIVDASIKQMQAYGELLANVVKSVDEYASDNVSDNNARDYLAQRFPGEIGIDVQPGSGALADGATEPVPQPKVAITSDDPAATMAKIGHELGWDKPPDDLSDDASEAELVRRAKLQLARQRQQMLASMVMLGINRIVVTDGHINAKVIFSMRASDVSKRDAKASLYDRAEEKSSISASHSGGGWFSPVQASVAADSSSAHMATVGSAVDETSESKGEVKAQLSGDVKVNFKSDYFPMEKMASPEMIGAIQGNSQPIDRPKPPPAAAAVKP